MQYQKRLQKEEQFLTLNGRKEMALAFQNFLQEFEIVYHFTGQHIVKIDGDIAT